MAEFCSLCSDGLPFQYGTASQMQLYTESNSRQDTHPTPCLETVEERYITKEECANSTYTNSVVGCEPAALEVRGNSASHQDAL